MSEHAFANALDIGGFRLADGGRVSVLKDWGLTRRDIAKAVLAEKKKAAEAAVAATNAPAAAPPLRSRNSVPSGRQLAARRPRSALPPVHIKRQRQNNQVRPPRGAITPKLPPPARATALPLPATGRARLPAARRALVVPRPASIPLSFDRAAASLMPPLPARRPLRQAVRQRANLNGATRPIPVQGLRSQQPAPARPIAKPPYRLGGPKAPGTAPRALFLRGVHQAACRIFGTTLGPEANEAHRNHFHFDMFPRRNGGYCE